MDAALLDACVPLKSYLCDTLLSIAEEGAFRPLWSDHVLEELRRNLIKAGAKEEAVEHRLGQMATYFPDARVTGYEELIGSMTNHPKDRHVLAAAVGGRADALVTENLRDFRRNRSRIWGSSLPGRPRPSRQGRRYEKDPAAGPAACAGQQLAPSWKASWNRCPDHLLTSCRLRHRQELRRVEPATGRSRKWV
jgi:predicted nucleic acid-binding protein